MEEEKKQKLEKARRRMDILNKWRLFFMFIAILLLVFIFWGGKVWDEAAWFINVRQKLYNFLWYDIVLLVLMTFAKLFAAMRYNSVVKKI